MSVKAIKDIISFRLIHKLRPHPSFLPMKKVNKVKEQKMSPFFSLEPQSNILDI
jgi:hypothetical protein